MQNALGNIAFLRIFVSMCRQCQLVPTLASLHTDASWNIVSLDWLGLGLDSNSCGTSSTPHLFLVLGLSALLRHFAVVFRSERARARPSAAAASPLPGRKEAQYQTGNAHQIATEAPFASNMHDDSTCWFRAACRFIQGGIKR